MKIGKIKPAATLVAQFAAGVEVEAIQHEGKMFLPVVGMGSFETTEAPEEKSSSKPLKEAPTKSKETSSKEETREYTEDELMEMSVKDLTNILKNDFDVDPNDYDGKNTNKKLRGLILDAQDGKSDSTKSEDEDDDDSSKEESDDLTEKVAEILEDFDSGTKNKKKTLATICKLVDDADKDAVTDLVDKFEDDADADIDKVAAKIARVLDGDSEKEDDADDEEEEEKPSKKSPKSKKKKEDLVDVDDLEVGDRVSVWWDDDNQEWFDGEVKSIKKGKVTIAYDDDTEEVIDPEVHTKIKRID